MQPLDSLNTSSVTTYQQAQHRKLQALNGAANSSTSGPYNSQHDQHNSAMVSLMDASQRLTQWNSDTPARTHQSDGTFRTHEVEKEGGVSDTNAPKEAVHAQVTITNSPHSSNKGKSTSFPQGVPVSTSGNVDQREIQRKRILNHVNELLTFCELEQFKPVTSIQQCTSSLFVLLYQRLFWCAIENIDISPNTLEKKRRNVALVLEELRKRFYTLPDISVEQVVRLNEDHVSRLIMVFVNIAEDMKYQQQRAAVAQALERASMLQTHPGYTVAEVTPPDMMTPANAYTSGGAAAAAGLGFDPNQPAALGGGASPEAFPYPVDHIPEYPGQPRYLHQHPPPDAVPGYPYPPPIHEMPEYKTGGERDYTWPQEASSGSYEEVDSANAEPLPYMSDVPIPKETFMAIWSREIVSPKVDPTDSPNHPYLSTRASGGGGRLHSSPAATPLRVSGGGGGGGAVSGSADVRHRLHRLSQTLLEPARRPRRTPGDTTVPTPSSTAVGAGNTSVDGLAVPVIAGVGERRAAPTKTTPLKTTPLKASPPVKSTPPRRPPAGCLKTLTGTGKKLRGSQLLHATRGGGRASMPHTASSRSATVNFSLFPPEETPLTAAECRLFASHPYSLFSSEERDRKIERLRASRFLNEMQTILHKGIRRQYDSRMAETRQSLKHHLVASKRNMLDGMRWIRDENNKYRDAYAVMMEAAANDKQMSQRMMSGYTSQLAKHYADSLYESQRMSAYLEDEKKQQDMMNLVRYAQRVTAWQQQLAV